MTDFFPYDELTWPEVADLPRDTPLVLPLGSDYDFNLLAAQLGNPARIGLLPPVPFGWRGSGLALPEPIFFQFVANLLASLRDDGFSRVYCLTPQGLDPQSFARLIPANSHLILSHSSQKQDNLSLPSDSEHGKVILTSHWTH